MAAASATVSVDAMPHPERTPFAVVAPGKTIRRLFPRLWICCWTAASAPRPMLTMVITAATPMMMPSIVSAERSLFRRSARSAVTKVIERTFMTSPPTPGGSSGGSCDGSRATDVGDDVPVAEGDAALGELGDVGLVRDEHDRDALVAVEADEQVQDVEARLRVEVAGRLVGEQERGAVHERPRDRDALLLPARELA